MVKWLDGGYLFPLFVSSFLSLSVIPCAVFRHDPVALYPLAYTAAIPNLGYGIPPLMTKALATR